MKSDVYIKLKYIQISLDIYQHISYHVHNKKKKEYNISTMKTHQMPYIQVAVFNLYQSVISNQNLQNDIVTTRL